MIYDSLTDNNVRPFTEKSEFYLTTVVTKILNETAEKVKDIWG